MTLNCQHEDFVACVDVNRLTDTGKYIADIRIKCKQCDESFRFIGVPAGLLFDRPACSIDSIELRVPIEPEGEARLQTSASFQMPEILKRN